MLPQLDDSLPAYGQRFRQLVLSIVERFGPLSTSTYELLASCLNCLAAAAVTKTNAAEVAAKLFASSILPSMERQTANAGGLNAILPGIVGTVLAGVECPQGSYSLTAAFLRLTSAFVQVNKHLIQQLDCFNFFFFCHFPAGRVGG